MTTVTIIETGIANIASVRAGLLRCGVEVTTSRIPDEIERAECLVLPGVGAFGAGMAELREAGLVEPIRRRVDDGRPLLAVCLGMHLLGVASEETPGVEGLGLHEGCASAFDTPGQRVPQMGWNRVAPDNGCDLIEPGYAYFANSYRMTQAPPGWHAAWTDYGGRFVAAIERGSVLACQFHPELSGSWGRDLLGRWIERATEGLPC